MMKFPRSVWVPILILAVGIFCWKVHSLPLTNWDEGIYANVNLELFHSHDWTKLTYFGKDFLEKPPLQFWLTFISFGIFGPTEIGVRIWSVLAGIATAILISLWVWQATRRRSTAFFAGLMFVLGRFALIHAFRTGDLDGLLTLSVTFALYSYWRSWTTPRWFFLFGVASAIAIMTKSVAGLLPLMIVGIDAVFARRWRQIGWGNIGWGIAALLAIAAPWHIIETVRFGSAFWSEYIGWNIVDRSTTSLFTSTPWYWYAGIIHDRFFPFSYLLPVTLFTAVWHWRRPSNELARLLLLWCGIVVLVFTFIQTRREWYILPFYPAAIVFISIQMDTWLRQPITRVLRIVLLLSMIGMWTRLVGDPHLRSFMIHVPGSAILNQPLFMSFGGQLVVGCCSVVVLAGIARLLKQKGWWTSTLQTQVSLMLLVALFWSIQFIRSQPTTLPLKTIASRLELERLPTVELIGTKLKKQPAGYFYILRLDTHTTEVPVGSSPHTPIILTTLDEANAALHNAGRRILTAGNFLLIDYRR